MVKNNTLYIVMPAYNEEENIRDVVASWYPKLELAGANSRLVVADSGSSDKTHEILVEMKNEYPQLEILEETDRQHGPKVIALYDYAIKTVLAISSRLILMDRQSLNSLTGSGISVSNTMP